MVAQQLLKEEYDFSIFGFIHDEDTTFRDRLPITKKTSAVLLGSYGFVERKEWILDPDANGKLVMVDAIGAIALSLRGINFVDNDGIVYGFTKDEKIFDIKGNLVLDRLLEPGQYLYLKKDGSLKTSYERPHPRKLQRAEKRDSVKVKIKEGLEWLDAGLTKLNDASIECGQIMSTEIISAQGAKGWSTKTVDVKVKGMKEKWYIIEQIEPHVSTVPHGEWAKVRLSLERVSVYDNEGFTVERFAVYGVFESSPDSKLLGLLPVGCEALNPGITVKAKVRYTHYTTEVLFSPF